MPAISTTSTKGIVSAILTRFLTFAPMGGGATLDTLLRALPTNPVTYSPAGTARLFKKKPPDNAVFPYGVMTVGPRFATGRDQMEREQFDVEILWSHRPASLDWELELIVDVADQAMLRWRDASGGFVGCKAKVRQEVPQPPASAPTDREIIQVRSLYSMIAWPEYLSQYKAA